MQLFLSSGKSTPPQKYLDHRSEIKNGDLLLYRGSSLVSRGIQYFDKAYYNHIGVVWIPENSGRVLTLDMWSGGLTCLPLSRRMSGYNDFCILRPKVDASISFEAVKSVLGMWDGRSVNYDFGLLLRFIIIKKTGIDITGLSEKGTYICSQFAQYYCQLLGINIFDGIDMITPQDFLRKMDLNFFDVLLQENK